MATEVNARKLAKSWQYDFKLPGEKRERKGGYRTKAAALAAGRQRMDVLTSGTRLITFSEAYQRYMTNTQMKDRARESFEHRWTRIGPILGHKFIEEITTSAMDDFKRQLPKHLGPRTVNNHLGLIRAVLKYMWKREMLSHVPYIPTVSVPTYEAPWYTTEERDRLLDGMFKYRPQWYLFFYLTCRLGLRKGEVYALSRRQIIEVPPQLVVDVQVQPGNGNRPPKITTRKNNAAYTIALSQDIMEAIRWHINQGFAGDEFLFSTNGTFPTRLFSHAGPLRDVQRKLGLRELSHHEIGRHSVASQAATGGESIKAIQAQLGHQSEQSTHRYAHLGSSAQLKVIEGLSPSTPPHASGSAW